MNTTSATTTTTTSRRSADWWPTVCASVLALAILVTGLTWATTAASGADAHGYISQADGWLAGRLTVDQSWASPAPWAMARWTLTPLGYRPSNLDGHAWDLVPSYPPGLPLLLAAGKAVGGQEGLFWIVPLSGALLVLATFAIARHLLGSNHGVAAAWLVATSPTLLFMLMVPMSDVPAAAAWAAAFWALLRPTTPRSVVAGVASGVAIAIRPNLAPLAVVMLIWIVARRSGPARADVRPALAYLPGAAAGALVVAAVNASLNGAPWVSGYGSLDEAYSWSRVGLNAKQYVGWLAETHTPLAVLGLIAAVLPVPIVWRRSRDRAAVVAMAVTVAVIWMSYLAYRSFDAWWYLRFLLPAWPFVMTGTVAALVPLARRGYVGRIAVALTVALMGAWQVHVAIDRGAFRLWRDERRAISAARAVEATTPRDAAIFCRQHSGSVRYYAGRLTVRFEEFEAGDLDRAVAWFASQGRPSYLLIDEAERPLARTALAGQQALERLSSRPVLHYSGQTEVYLYRLDAGPDPAVPTRIIREDWTNTRSVPPSSAGRPGLLP